jgi:signal transduction histidine kinase
MIYFTSPQGSRRSHTASPRQTPGTPPGWLQILGLSSALATVARRSTVPVTLDVAIDCRLPESVEVATYCVVAEAVANAAKHAQPSRVTVSARKAREHLQIAVHDDGRGGADLSKGSGLIGLKDRIEALSGTMRLVSRRGSGTSLYVKIPLNVEH